MVDDTVVALSCLILYPSFLLAWIAVYSIPVDMNLLPIGF